MPSGSEILKYLRPDGGWVISGNDFDSIIYDKGVIPITKEEFDLAVIEVDKWKINQQAELEAKRKALLDRLGITEEEAKLLLS